MRESWDRRIERATQLAAGGGDAQELLLFYGRLLRLQKALADRMTRSGRQPTAALDLDLPLFREGLPAFLEDIARSGPELLASEAQELLAAPDARTDDLLLACWHDPSDRQFFAKAVLQPYAQWLAECGMKPRDRQLVPADNRCPFCAGAPQLSVLHGSGVALEGGGRSLQCATCLTTWPFRRVLCSACGEEAESKLGYFHSPSHDHIRVDACDTCRRYLKTVDLTRLGFAVPLVDEIAGAVLDVWAREQGYQKIELNLVGL